MKRQEILGIDKAFEKQMETLFAPLKDELTIHRLANKLISTISLEAIQRIMQTETWKQYREEAQDETVS